MTTYEEAHHGDTHEKGLHGFASLGEIIVLDSSSDELRFALGILNGQQTLQGRRDGLQ